MEDAIMVGAVEDIDQGEATTVRTAEAGTIAVFHADDGNFYALDDTCTHETASLSDGWIDGTQVECPIHSASFCLRTGKALCLPATRDARTHEVDVRDGQVWVHPNVAGVLS